MSRGAAGARGAYSAVTALFFGWGFITSLVDPLVASVKSIFSLSNVEAQLSTFAFFIAYGAVSLPAALLVVRLARVQGVVVGLGLMTAGCLVIMLACDAASYPGVLAGLFVIASGVTILQVAANPLAAALGPPERSHFRLTFSQGFNALGTVLGPLVGAKLLLRGLETAPGRTLDAAGRGTALAAINGAFLLIAGLIVLVGLLVWAMRRRIEGAAPRPEPMMTIGRTLGAVFGARWALIGGTAIFLYVGAEVSIGTQMALFLHAPDIWNMPLQQAGYFVSFYWLGAMVGRFIGSGLMITQPAHRLLACATLAALGLCAVAFLIGGPTAGYAALAIGLCNSIMFPTIFSLTLERSTASEAATAGFLCTAIIGGAMLPLLAGAISDADGYARSFVVPAFCYLALFGFARAAGRMPVARGRRTVAVALH